MHSGFIGLPVALAFARAGHIVYGTARDAKAARKLAIHEIIPIVTPATAGHGFSVWSKIAVDVDVGESSRCERRVGCGERERVPRYIPVVRTMGLGWPVAEAAEGLAGVKRAERAKGWGGLGAWGWSYCRAPACCFWHSTIMGKLMLRWHMEPNHQCSSLPPTCKNCAVLSTKRALLACSHSLESRASSQEKAQC